MNAKHILLFLLLGYSSAPALTVALTLSQSPFNLGQGGTPLIMLTMERDHKLYYEAYNDASDINGDGVLDIHYNPAINYFGYFDSHKCYSYGSGKFSPIEITMNKQCSSTWSGDYLNYLTMSRMDALRRVLYGGKRSIDTNAATVLERSYIPQDAHSWGKEYTSTAVDGYDISDYAPLEQPTVGTRHLFANTTLLCPSGNSDPGCGSNSGKPLLRVLNDTDFRVWEWLSIERPVAGVQCATGNNSRTNCVGAGGQDSSHPSDHSSFSALISRFANASHLYGSGSASTINGSGNPHGDDDYYITVFQGTLKIKTGESGNYQFAVDGDDAVEVMIDGNVVAGYYGGHGNCNCQTYAGTINLSSGDHTITFWHEEVTGGDNYYLYWKRPGKDWEIAPALSNSRGLSNLTQTTYNRNITSASTMTDYVVRVDACVADLLESECRGYPTNAPIVYKPAGILQTYGEPDRMAFGLITGSYTKNVSGGVLRKNISSLTDEIDPATGQFTNTNGVIKSIDALKIIGFGSSYSYDQNCGVPEVGGPLAEGRCRMWGNPTAEIMYEGLRYFAGKASPSSAYSIANSGNDDNTLGLPLPTWQNPYRSSASGGFPECSKPSLFVISDINPNFDTDLLPGRHSYTLPSATPAFSNDTPEVNVESLADLIWNTEYGAPASLFIGQSGEIFDGAPTAKTVTSFGNMRGLSPEEPTQQGGYYTASIGLFGKTHDLNSANGDQKTDTFSVALASPLPRISFPLNGHNVTLVPFAKTVGGCGSVSATQGNYQPTNTIVDFYVDTIKNTDSTNIDDTVNSGRPYAKFRINYEDSEYGSDHDMDAIAEYELTAKADNTLDIKSSSNYAAGGCIQHMGYVISGTSADGIYLEIRDPDTGAGSDIDYYLDTPNTAGVALPTSTTRNFSSGSNLSSAFVAHDPLWYAAKWGGFIDSNNNNMLDTTEWDTRDGGDDVPDSYFLVTNASKLKEQLDRAFTEILARDSSSSSVATNSTSLKTESRIFQARFNSLHWSGQLLSFKISTAGIINPTPEWDAGSLINAQTDRVILTKSTDGVAFDYDNLVLPSALDSDIAGFTDNCGPERVAYLRGSTDHEATNGTFTCASGTSTRNFRQRPTSKLGDIVNSNPLFVGAPSAGFSNADQPGYGAFRRNKLNRKTVVYVGANDGMLHGFEAASGKEILAYIPTAVFPYLSGLTSPSYNQNHHYFVDGSPMMGDIDLGSLDWHSVLIGAMGAGGKGYYALDITDPDGFTESAAANIVLWEFNEIDMGYAFNMPPTSLETNQARQIVKLANGKWAAIVGNGYSSVNGKAVLYILFINDGIDGTWTVNADYVKIVADAPAGLDNGLSTPVPFDTDGDGYADTVYAGDLKGHLWKFLIGPSSDIHSDNHLSGITSDTSTWKVAFSSNGCTTCTSLFTAIDDSGLSQPIIWPPEVTPHPNGGQMVLFGTGKYIDSIVDPANTDPQTFYGIWDRHVWNNGTPSPLGTRVADLLQQTVETTLSTSAENFRVPSSNPINWRSEPPATSGTPTYMGWYMDFPTSGERTTGIPKLINQIIFFNTLIPSTDICEAGGTGWLMSLDYLTGGLVTSHPIFDTGGNGTITASDDANVGGVQVGAALGGTTLIMPPASNAPGVAVSSLTNGNLTPTLFDPGRDRAGRLSWRELTP